MSTATSIKSEIASNDMGPLISHILAVLGIPTDTVYANRLSSKGISRRLHQKPPFAEDDFDLKAILQ